MRNTNGRKPTKFGEWLGAARDQKGVSYAELGRMARMSANQIYRIEKGLSATRPKSVMMLATALGKEEQIKELLSIAGFESEATALSFLQNAAPTPQNAPVSDANADAMPLEVLSTLNEIRDALFTLVSEVQTIKTLMQPTEAQKLLLHRLSLHPEDFSLDAVRRIGGIRPLDESSAEMLLARLVDRGDILKSKRKGFERYRLNEAIRDDMRLQMESSPLDVETVREVFTDFYIDLKQTANTHRHGDNWDQWQLRIEIERPNYDRIKVWNNRMNIQVGNFPSVENENGEAFPQLIEEATDETKQGRTATTNRNR